MRRTSLAGPSRPVKNHDSQSPAPVALRTARQRAGGPGAPRGVKGPAGRAPAGVQGAVPPDGPRAEPGPGAGRSPARLESCAISVTADDFSLLARAKRARRLVERANERAELAGDPAAGRWHRERARAAARGPAQRAAECGHRILQVYHHGTGEIEGVPEPCRQLCCPRCMVKRKRKLVARALQAVRAVTMRQQARHRRPWLLTLTVRRLPGDGAAQQRQRIAAAWPKFRASLHKLLGWSPEFLRVDECAAKASPNGHAHWHIVAWLPRILPFSDIQRIWNRALGCQKDYSKEEAKGNIDLQAGDGADQAVAYAFKALAYVGKSAFDITRLDEQRAAEYLEAMYGQRTVATSRGFWLVEYRQPVAWGVWTTPRRRWAPGPMWWRQVDTGTGPP